MLKEHQQKHGIVTADGIIIDGNRRASLLNNIMADESIPFTDKSHCQFFIAIILPEDADKILRDLNGGSNASYAIRFAASFPNIAVVLSGMSDMPQMEDNISAMKDFMPLTEAEHEAVRKVCDIFKGLNLIPCTSCRYCIEESECPKGIRIPDLFAALNAHEAFHNWNTGYYYDNIITGNGHGRASDCIKCGKCERVCPQHLEIRNLLTKVAATFDH